VFLVVLVPVVVVVLLFGVVYWVVLELFPHAARHVCTIGGNVVTHFPLSWFGVAVQAVHLSFFYTFIADEGVDGC